MFSEAPPSRAEVTTSLTCRDSTEVNTFTSSGIIAPARVPQEMIEASFHHRLVSPARSGMMRYDTAYVSTMEMIEVIHTSEVSGASKFMRSELLYLPRAIASFRKYAAALETSIMTRMTKIHTSNCTWMVGFDTASRMKVI